jgi:hypothetical protein
MHPELTIFCAFTRSWAFEEWLENLKKVRHDPTLVNLCFIVDGNLPLVANMLKKFAVENNYKSFHVKINDDWHANEVRLSIRRQRIAEIHNQAKDLIARTSADIIIGFEDDTVFDRMESFDPLIYPLINTTEVGFVQGVQVGRWGANMVGAWEADNIRNPLQIKTLLPPAPNDEENSAYQEITAGGWYGFATRRRLFLNCDNYSSTSQPWGPDVNYGFYINEQGYICLINWDLLFGHKDHNVTLYADDDKLRLAQIIYNKNEDTGKWDRIDNEPTRY